MNLASISPTILLNDHLSLLLMLSHYFRVRKRDLFKNENQPCLDLPNHPTPTCPPGHYHFPLMMLISTHCCNYHLMTMFHYCRYHLHLMARHDHLRNTENAYIPPSPVVKSPHPDVDADSGEQVELGEHLLHPQQLPSRL